jgi:hypothetical protein
MHMCIDHLMMQVTNIWTRDDWFLQVDKLGSSSSFGDLWNKGGDVQIIYMENPPKQLMPWQLEDFYSNAWVQVACDGKDTKAFTIDGDLHL